MERCSSRGLVAVSRPFENPIQNDPCFFGRARNMSHHRARPRSWAGGYMRGAKEGAVQEGQRMQLVVQSLSCRPASPEGKPAIADGTRRSLRPNTWSDSACSGRSSGRSGIDLPWRGRFRVRPGPPALLRRPCAFVSHRTFQFFAGTFANLSRTDLHGVRVASVGTSPHRVRLWAPRGTPKGAAASAPALQAGFCGRLAAG